MSINVPKEKNGVYKFECGEETYTYRTRNLREYSNEEFMNLLKTSHTNFMYYQEPCTMWNDPDGNLVSFPRNEKNDEDFLFNVKTILVHTENEEKKKLINRILNDCFVVDKEPKLKDGFKLDDKNLTFLETKKFGAYHIDRYALKDIYRDTINFISHRYIKEFNNKSHYTSKEEENINLLLK